MSGTYLGMPSFPKAAREAVHDVTLRANLRHATHTIRDKRAKAAAEPDYAASMKLQGTRVAYLNAKDYGAFLDKIDGENKTIMTDLGLIKK